MNIRIRDNNFSHGDSSCHDRSPKNFKWDRNIYESNICFFTDNCLHLVNSDPSKIKIAWLCEPIAINSYIYDYIKHKYNDFDYILTYDKDLINIDNNKFLFYPHGGCWIKDCDIKIYEKNKLCSIISSNKRMTIGHNLRHEIISKYDNIDVYGRGYKPIENKILGIKDYMFHIVIENSIQDDYFTEKIIDSLALGSIPIYYGTKNINNYFNGILCFNNIIEFDEIFKKYVNMEYFNNTYKNIYLNHNETKKYIIAEDYIFEKYNFLFK